MSEIVAIAKNTSCLGIGGVRLAYATEYTNITAVTVGTGGEITALTMATPAQWGKLSFDDEDNQAYYNEEGELVGNRVVSNGTGFMLFNGLTQAKIEAANQAKACCGLVIIWFHYSGIVRVQGIDVDPTDDSWSFSKRLPRIVPNVLSDTGENAERMEYNVTHQGLQFSPTTTLDEAAIEAL